MGWRARGRRSVCGGGTGPQRGALGLAPLRWYGSLMLPHAYGLGPSSLSLRVFFSTAASQVRHT